MSVSKNIRLLLYEMFYINLLSPFKAVIHKASLKTRNSRQQTSYIESTALPASFLVVFFLFNLAFIAIYLLKISCFNWARK